VIDEESFFKNLVNPSLSKNKPYYGWARYREAYSGELVKELIKRSKLDPKKHFIYDPMSGSGSTQLGALELGFDSIGNDINPYAVDITNAKLHPYTDNDLAVVLDFISREKPPFLKGSKFFKRVMNNCENYFDKNNAAALQKIIDQVAKIKNESARNLLNAVWLTILEDCSNRKKDGNGLATRPTKIRDVWASFCKAAKNVLKDLQSNPLPDKNLAVAVMDSSFNASKIVKDFSKKIDKQLGAIIFSPPYANSFDYFESYKLELLCGYYTQDELIEARKSAIRSYRKGYGYNLETKDHNVKILCEEIRERIPLKEKKTGVVDNRSRLVPNLLIGYFEDMGKTIEQFSISMPKGSCCYIVVDQSAYLGVIVPSDLLLAELGSKHGLTVEKLIRCRTAKTSAQQLKEYPYLRTFLRESIVVLKKP
jgi:site-specific DNA-methyltransferase (adenine-specific)